MISIIYNSLGILMLIWYACIRWTWFADRIKYSWAYAPINMTTAFLSVIFVIPTLFHSEYLKSSETLAHTFYWMAVFLMVRNIYYTIEDTADLFKALSEHNYANINMQILFIVIDLMMVIYPYLYLVKR